MSARTDADSIAFQMAEAVVNFLEPIHVADHQVSEALSRLHVPVRDPVAGTATARWASQSDNR